MLYGYIKLPSGFMKLFRSGASETSIHHNFLRNSCFLSLKLQNKIILLIVLSLPTCTEAGGGNEHCKQFLMSVVSYCAVHDSPNEIRWT